MKVLILLALAAVATANLGEYDYDNRVYHKSLEAVEDVSIYDEIWDNQDKYAQMNEDGISNFILNGTDVPLGRYPFVARVSISRRNAAGAVSTGLCSGSYITVRYAFTSAHCVDSNPQQIFAIASLVGTVDRSIAGGTTMQMEDFWFYIKLRTLVGDLALVRADQNLPTGNANIAPIRMPTRAQQADRWDGLVRLVGWGRDNTGASAIRLQWADFEAVPLSRCLTSFDARYEICYIDPQSWRMSQPGDSGAPVIAIEADGVTQVGIHAGRRTSGGNTFHSAARIGQFVAWIEANTSVRFR